jgi:glutamate-1-semialdehyde 2,1-aminomutase
MSSSVKEWTWKNLSFDGDEHFERALVFADECARRGVFVHPSHNWFLSSAHTQDDVDRTLEAMGHAFARVAAALGTG